MTCRRTSISKNRSWACTKPCASIRSSSESAYSCGMPCSSRTTSTSAARPGTSSSPEVCGSGRRTTTTPATRRDDQEQDQPDRDVRRPAGRGRPAAEGRRATSPTTRPDRSAPRRSLRPRGRWWGCSWCCHCAVVFGSQDRRVPAGPPRGRARADLPVRLHRVRPRLRAGPELQRRLADPVPRVRRPAAQGLQRGRRGLQGLRLLPQRQPQRRGLDVLRLRQGVLEGLRQELRVRSSESGSSTEGSQKSETSSTPAAAPASSTPSAPSTSASPRPRRPDPVERPPAAAPVRLPSTACPTPRSHAGARRRAGTGSLVG